MEDDVPQTKRRHSDLFRHKPGVDRKENEIRSSSRYRNYNKSAQYGPVGTL